MKTFKKDSLTCITLKIHCIKISVTKLTNGFGNFKTLDLKSMYTKKKSKRFRLNRSRRQEIKIMGKTPC